MYGWERKVHSGFTTACGFRYPLGVLEYTPADKGECCNKCIVPKKKKKKKEFLLWLSRIESDQEP